MNVIVEDAVLTTVTLAIVKEMSIRENNDLNELLS
ncbi:hypothetical protein FHS14_003439 [Paenibacillus baekrokdamisoli]|nr:hypothetical protein [Paenibacillus baekrokdamisoli]